MNDAIVIRAPVPLSPGFIDYPYLTFLGTCQAAAVLRQAGWQVRILDGLTADGADLIEEKFGFRLGIDPDSFLESLEKVEARLAVVHLDSFLRTKMGLSWLDRIVGTLDKDRVGTLVLAEMVTGGMHELGLDGEELLGRHPAVDLVLRFEGERLLQRLAADLSAGSRPERAVWEETSAFPLDDLPQPAFDLLDLESTFSFLQRVLDSAARPGPFPAEPRRTLPLITSRGCPYECVFCSGRPGLGAEGRKVRVVAWERVDRWLEGWLRDSGLERVVILDDVANLDRTRFGDMLDSLERLALRVEFPNGLRADRLEEEDIRRLSRLTPRLKVSLESASKRVQQEVLKKNLDPEAVERVARWCQQADLSLGVHCLVGLPGETREEINQTLETAARLASRHGVQPLVQYAVPLPDTPLWRTCRDAGLLQENPEDWHVCFQETPVIETAEFDRRFLGQAVASLNRVLEPPAGRKVIVNLTYRCNNHCIFCAVGDRPSRDADSGEVIAALRRYHDQGYRLLDIDGGEPTVHPDLFEVIRAGHRMGYERITLVSNARRLSYAAYARELVQAGVGEVLVSLHSPDAAGQAEVTGVPDSFEQTTAGLLNILSQLGSRRVAVNTTLVRANLEDAPRLADWLISQGVRRWNLQVVTPFGRARGRQVPDPKDLQRVLGGLLEAAPAEMQLQVINCPPCLLPGHEAAAAVDFDKAARDMVFVGESGENLQAFLSSKRTRDQTCQCCPQLVQCPGHYRFGPEEP
jgi:MoaA/NifB/PqqE/SkfB family radical SAM enzyme